jgi:hypothetical protein
MLLLNISKRVTRCILRSYSCFEKLFLLAVKFFGHGQYIAPKPYLRRTLVRQQVHELF